MHVRRGIPTGRSCCRSLSDGNEKGPPEVGGPVREHPKTGGEPVTADNGPFAATEKGQPATYPCYSRPQVDFQSVQLGSEHGHAREYGSRPSSCTIAAQ